MRGVAPGELEFTHFIYILFVSITLYHPQLGVAVKRYVRLDLSLIGEQEIGQNLSFDLAERRRTVVDLAAGI